MSTRRQRQILRNKRIAFERKMDENIRKSKEPEVKPEEKPEETPEKKEEVKIVKKKKTTKKEDK